MANTVTLAPGTITIAPDGSTDLDLTTIAGIPFPNGMYIKAIKFYPNAANDICIIRQGSNSGTIISKFKDTTGGGAADTDFSEYLYKPYLKGAEGVSGSLIMIMYKA